MRAKTTPAAPKTPVQVVLLQMWEKAVASLPVFLFGDEKQNSFCFTLDEHATDEEKPIKRFPDRPHLRVLTDVWLETQYLLVAKSRQMMVSWFVLAAVLWECLHPGKRWLIACKKFDAADGLLERIWTIYQQLPEFLRPKATRKQGSIVIHHPGAPSYITACAQDSEAPRSMTYSGVVVDEAAYTSNLQDLYAAAMPTAQSGGKVVLVSSPNGRGFFYQLLTDNERLAL